MKPVIVTPTYNEALNIEKLLTHIFALPIENLEVIVVDDNSPDGTADIAERFSPKHPVHVVRRKEKSGLGSAYKAGFAKALEIGADRIIQMDADLSHDPDDIVTMLDSHADLVIGSRKIKGGSVVGWGFIRTFISAGAMWFSRLMLGLKARDVTAGFRCFSSSALRGIHFESVHSNGYAFQEEMLYRTEKQGFSVAEIPVTFVDRQKGKSKLSKKDIIEFFMIMLKLRFGSSTKK